MQSEKSGFDFYSAAALLAVFAGFGWVWLAMVVLKIPAWPAMVGMAGYYAVSGLACHQCQANFSRGLKGFLLGIGISWIGVWIWMLYFKGNPVAMGLVMGIAAALFVLATKWRFGEEQPFIAMPQSFLGATIFFGLFNTYMIAKGVPPGTLSGSLQSLVLPGPVQPHIAGVLAVISAVSGLGLGYVHQKLSLALSHRINN
jgi:hypothetical protein